MTEPTTIKTRLEACGAIEIGEKPSRAQDYVFVGERDAAKCALLVGRELRDDWDELDSDDTPAAVQVLARADDLFLPLANGTPQARLDTFRRGFRQVVNQSQQKLRQGAKEHHGEAPSLTITLAYIDGSRLYVGHVGDDRCYLLRNHRLQRMTTDHTAGPSPAETQAVSDPMLSQKVMNVVGGFSDDLETETTATSLKAGDIVLLCSKGIATTIPDATIEEVLGAGCRAPSTSVEALARNLLRAVPDHQRSTDRAVALARLCSADGLETHA
jgi:serine/threonine protein phosphatase PrpC